MRLHPSIGFVVFMAFLGLAAGCIKDNSKYIGTAGDTDGTQGADSEVGPSTTGTTTTASTSSSATGPTDTTGVGACAPVLSSVRLTVFADTCTDAACHSGDAPAGALDLVNVDTFEHLLDVPSSTCLDWRRVVASAPEQSILYAKVAGIATCDVVDPVAHDPLPEDMLQCLAAWIESIPDCERCGGTECIDLGADPAHCGQCEQACPNGISCTAGQCDCPGGGATCDAQCVDLQTDDQHCGGCGNDCEDSPCDGGVCECIGLTLCDGCVDTTSDPLHCGGCDQPCSFGRKCVDSACACDSATVSFATAVQPLFTEHCVSNGCHGGPSPKQDLSLEAGAAHGNLVGVLANECEDGRLRVESGVPEDSYLMHKLLGINICDGVQMPSTGGPSGGIDSEAIDAIAAWICQGAQNN